MKCHIACVAILAILSAWQVVVDGYLFQQAFNPYTKAPRSTGTSALRMIQDSKQQVYERESSLLSDIGANRFVTWVVCAGTAQTQTVFHRENELVCEFRPSEG
jgi:hypothetical protein